jgi:hypothetical protein
MSKDDLAALPKDLSLERLVAACIKRGADPHDVLAIALSDEARLDASETGMTLKAQADLSWKIIDKAEPSKQAIKHSGDDEAPFVIHYSRDDEKL